MSKDLIRYDILAQEALRGLVRRVLQDTARAGLPGEHHFFITFDSGAPGVRLSQRLRNEHPEEMTIVVQHQFWDLKVSESDFEVSLSFNGVAEHLRVPFSAIKGFFDPSVSFGLQFDPSMTLDDATDGHGEIAATLPDIGIDPTGKKSGRGKSGVNSEDEGAVKADDRAGNTTGDGSTDDSDGAEVVSLDAFRKKT